MLFNSFEFIFIFLPIVFIVYFFFIKKRLFLASKIWLIVTSLVFYSWWNMLYLPLILMSILFNFAIGSVLCNELTLAKRKALLSIGIILNLGLLGYFKYTDFFITNINCIFSSNFDLLKLALPLGISFFTFQQIGYLADSYRGETKNYSFLNYMFFVTFFPQLIAGPIVHHKEIMSQMYQKRNKIINYKNISLGFFIFTIGLFKKVALADTFSILANEGYNSGEMLSFIEGWAVSLSYTLQIYFDFSGYTDMAIGAALLFNIKLPINFNSPYKALNIKEFWRRWHITLGRFLTKYIYIPLGGNRKGQIRTYVNIMSIFLISGLWHGAGWTFVFWGFLHGFATVVYYYWSKLDIKMNKIVAWLITFSFINITWVFFRAETFSKAINILKAMLGINGFSLSSTILPNFIMPKIQFLVSYHIEFVSEYSIPIGKSELMFLIFGLLIILIMKNSIEITWKFKPEITYSIFIIILFIYSVLNLTKMSEFIYFNF
jgi:alginate O-acetyltransferase complex protein AlgI